MILVSLAFLSLSMVYAGGGEWTIVNDTIYVNDSRVFASVTPHTISDFSEDIIVNFTSKVYTGDVYVVFGFNTTETKPEEASIWKPTNITWNINRSNLFINVSSITTTTAPCTIGDEDSLYRRNVTYLLDLNEIACFDYYIQDSNNYTTFWNETRWKMEYWKDFTEDWESYDYEYGGMSKWYYKDVSIVANKSYKLKVDVNVNAKLGELNGKYWFGFYPEFNCIGAKDCLITAIATDRLYYIDPWWNTTFDKCKNITISNNGSTTLTNYPAYINVTYDSDMETDFTDLRFVNESCNEGGSELDYEIENYTASGQAHTWVRIPSLPVGKTNISVYYDNQTGVGSGENPTGVWDSDYVMVQHLQETDGLIFDSTNHDSDADVFGGAVYTQYGKIDGAYALQGTDDYMRANDSVIFDVTAGFTLCAWANPVNTDAVGRLIYRVDAVSLDGYQITQAPTDSGIWRFVTYVNPNVAVSDSDSAPTGDWQYICGVRLNDGTTYMYVDGKRQADVDSLAGAIDSTSNVWMGVDFGLSADYNGLLDEARISNSSRTADWINQSYNMVVYQSSHVIFGAEESSLATAPNIIITSPPNNTTTNNNTLDIWINVIDNEDLTSRCTLYFNETGNVSYNASVINDTLTNMTVTSAQPDGLYFVWVDCDDGVDSNQSLNYTLEIDTVKPGIDWVSPTPANESFTGNKFVYLNTTITDTHETSAWFDWNYTLTGYWAMDWYNSTGIFDNSTHQNNASMGGTSFSSANITYGRFGKALEFDGANDYLRVPDDDSLNPTGQTEVSYFAWIKPSFNLTNGGSQWYNYIMYKPANTFLLGWSGWSHDGWECNVWSNNSSSDRVAIWKSTPLVEDEWQYVGCVFNGTSLRLYIDGNLEASNDSIDYFVLNNTVYDLFIGSKGSSADERYNFNGTLDEVKLWNRAISWEEVNASYNNSKYRLMQNFTDLENTTYNYTAYAMDTAGNLNITEERRVQITEAVTSAYAQNLKVSDLSFSDTNYVSTGNQFFNTTEDNVNITIYTAMNLEKMGGGGGNVITGRIVLDDITVIEQDLISIEVSNEVGVAGFKPFLVNVSSGEHNFTIELKRSGLGNILATDVDVVLEKFVSAHNNTIFAEVENETLTFDYGTYTAIESGSYTPPTPSPMLNVFQFLVNASDNNRNLALFSQNNDTLVQLPGIERGLPSSSGFGSVMTTGIDTAETAFYNHTIFAKVDPAGNVTINGSEIHMALRDNDLNRIHSSNDTNKSTNLTNTISLGAGTHRIASFSHTLMNGTGVFLMASASLSTSSGIATPTLFVNSSNSTVPEDICYSKKERYLKTNNESKNLFLYEACGFNLTVRNTYEFNLYLTVPVGRTVVLYDESLTAHDITGFPTVSEIDLSAPGITIVPPSVYNVTINQSWIFVNISLNESGSGAWVDLNGTNYSMIKGVNDTLWHINITGRGNGNWTWKAYARDYSDNDAVTGDSWVFITSKIVAMDSSYLLVEIYIVFSLIAISLFVFGALNLSHFDRGLFLLALAMLFFVIVAFYSFAIVKFGVGGETVLSETFSFFTLGVFYSFMILLTIGLMIFFSVQQGVESVGIK